jgi:hypothetical protein
MVTTATPSNALPYTDGKIITAQRMRIYRKFGARLRQLPPSTKTIRLRNVGLIIPRGSNTLLSDDLSSGNIYFITNKNSISFYRKLGLGENYEALGGVAFDKEGYLLIDGKRFNSKSGKQPNFSDRKRYEYSIVRFIDTFGATERIIKLPEVSGNIRANVKGIPVTFSKNPDNIFYNSFDQGRIAVRVWPEGKVEFFQLTIGDAKLIGSTTLTRLRHYLEETGKKSVYIPDLIGEFGVFLSPVTRFSQKPGESPKYSFNSGKIMFSIIVTEEMVYAKDIIDGKLYHKEYADRIEVGFVKLNKFTPIGEIRFDSQGRILHGNEIYLKDGKPVQRNTDKIGYASLKILVPELTAIEKSFEHVTYKHKGGRIEHECRATAMGKVFVLGAARRNPLVKKVKEGRVKLKLTPDKVSVYIGGSLIGSAKIDSAGNILYKDGSIAFPADKKRITLTKVIARLDVERGRFIYKATAKGKDSPVKINIKGICFKASVGKTWFHTKGLRTGKVYWRRSGNKVEVFRKGFSSPIGCFRIDLKENEIIRSDGLIISIPPNKEIDLLSCVPALRLEIGRVHDYKMIDGNCIEISFKHYKQSTPRYRAYAMGRLFFIKTRKGRNPFASYVKSGNLKLRVYPHKLEVRMHSKILGTVNLDTAGNIINAEGEIVYPAGQKKVDLTTLIEKVDVEKGRFTCTQAYSASRSYPGEYAMLKINNIRFVINLNPDLIYTNDIKRGRIYWQRMGNKVEIRRQRVADPLAVFFIDEENNNLIIGPGPGVSRPIPKSRKVNLIKYFPAFGLKLDELDKTAILPEDLMRMLKTHDSDRIDWLLDQSPIKLIFALVQRADSQELTLGERLLLSKYCFALNKTMSRIASEVNLEKKERFTMFCTVFQKFIEVVTAQIHNGLDLNGFRDILDLHIEDLRDYTANLVDKFGKGPVMMSFRDFNHGYLWPYVSPIFTDL